MGRLFGTDGVRGVVNEKLTSELAMSIGRALCSMLSPSGKYRPLVLIGTDTRRSCHMLMSALGAGVCSAGGDVINLGVIPTPAVAFLVKKYGAGAGVVISASHNSYEYGGIKIFSSEGFKLDDELEEKIESIVRGRSPAPSLAKPGKIGRFLDTPPVISDYTEYIKSFCDTSLLGLRVGIDCANGAAYKSAKRIFPSLGCECFFIGDGPDGVNINDKCGSTHLDALRKLVKGENLDVGIAFDGDADRCLALDSEGNEVDGDFIMAILADELLKRGKLRGNAVVGTVMTNLGFVKFCEERGINFVAARVGDRYVLELMRLDGLSFGGEQSGHIIFGDYSTTGDGQLTAVALLATLKKSGKSLTELASLMKKYPQFTHNVDADADEKVIFLSDREIAEEIKRAEAKLGDGRIIVRPSGTEPYIRVMAEGEDRESAEQAAKQTALFIRKRLDSYK